MVIRKGKPDSYRTPQKGIVDDAWTNDQDTHKDYVKKVSLQPNEDMDPMRKYMSLASTQVRGLGAILAYCKHQASWKCIIPGNDASINSGSCVDDQDRDRRGQTSDRPG